MRNASKRPSHKPFLMPLHVSRQHSGSFLTQKKKFVAIRCGNVRQFSVIFHFLDPVKATGYRRTKNDKPIPWEMGSGTPPTRPLFQVHQ
jgi:hypothetical protein